VTVNKEPIDPTRLQRLLAKALGVTEVHQVHQIVLREVDAYADDKDVGCVVLFPIGGVLGIAIVKEGEWPRDEDIVFVSASAFGNALPALGFTVRGPVSYIIPPGNEAPPEPRAEALVKLTVEDDEHLRKVIREAQAAKAAREARRAALDLSLATPEEKTDVEG
jgi:hypothetical protein